MSFLVAMLLSQVCSPTCNEVSVTQTFDHDLWCSGAVYVNQQVVAYPGHSVELDSDRHDDHVGVIVGSVSPRDAGAAFEVRRGPSSSDRLFQIDTNTGNTMTGCDSNATESRCSFDDESGISGHWSLTCAPRYYVTIAGGLSLNHYNRNVDGGTYGNVDGGDDGGSYLPFTVDHGELTVVAKEARPNGGCMFQVANPVSDGTNPNRFCLDVWGGMAQTHLMIRAQFPKCPADIVHVVPQTWQIYVNGAHESTMLYAFDEHEWYFCDPSGWQPMRTGGGYALAERAFTRYPAALGLIGAGLVLALLASRKR